MSADAARRRYTGKPGCAIADSSVRLTESGRRPGSEAKAVQTIDRSIGGYCRKSSYLPSSRLAPSANAAVESPDGFPPVPLFATIAFHEDELALGDSASATP